jgi:hypothetical protein
MAKKQSKKCPVRGQNVGRKKHNILHFARSSSGFSSQRQQTRAKGFEVILFLQTYRPCVT